MRDETRWFCCGRWLPHEQGCECGVSSPLGYLAPGKKGRLKSNRYSEERKRRAKEMWVDGAGATEISSKTSTELRTVRRWIKEWVES